jgi:hypothetical protein
MTHVFISHVEEDATLAREIAASLEARGYTAWYYERDSVPGPSYLYQVLVAIHQSAAVVVVLSRDTLGSWQVDKEVIQAHETGKAFIPLLLGIDHAEFRRRRPDWAMAMGAATSLCIPPDGVATLLPRLAEGLRMLDVLPGGKAPDPARPFTHLRLPGPGSRARWRWRVTVRRVVRHRAFPLLVVLLVVLLIAATVAVTRPPAPTPAGGVSAACCGARFFPQTRHNMRGAFLAFYDAYGGVDTFGYPRTEAVSDHGRLVQYTDRFELELVHGRVMTAPLGRLLTEGRHFARVAPFRDSSGRLYFAGTGHSLSERFLRYWQTHNGAVLLGAPISEVDGEQNGDGTGFTYQVQWFEKGRLEYHPEQEYARYEVELGLAGKEALQRRGWLPPSR